MVTLPSSCVRPSSLFEWLSTELQLPSGNCLASCSLLCARRALKVFLPDACTSCLQLLFFHWMTLISFFKVDALKISFPLCWIRKSEWLSWRRDMNKMEKTPLIVSMENCLLHCGKAHSSCICTDFCCVAVATAIYFCCCTFLNFWFPCIHVVGIRTDRKSETFNLRNHVDTSVLRNFGLVSWLSYDTSKR